MNLRLVGAEGENQAAEYLLERGYIILHRNFGCRFGEVDLVVLEPTGVVVFVEVKAGRDKSYGSPALRISPSKLRTITKVADLYLRTHNLVGKEWRIDAVIVWNDSIRWLKNCITV